MSDHDEFGRSLLLLHSDTGYASFAVADGDPSKLVSIESEQLLKAADALDDKSYWTGDVVATDQGSGIWRLTKTAAAYKYIAQALVNWFPTWGATFSFFGEFKAGSLDTIYVSLEADGGGANNDSEVISGNATISSNAYVESLDSEWSNVRITGTAKGWSTSVSLILYVDWNQTDAGYVDVRNPQLVLGDQAKPRPVQANVGDWMMAYRPDNRLLGDGNGRYQVVDSERRAHVCEPTHVASLLGSPVDVETGADFRVSFDLTVDATKTFSTLGRRVDANNFIRVRQLSDSIDVFQYYDSVWKQLGSTASSVLTDTETHHIAITFDGTSVIVEVDDATVIDDAETDGHFLTEETTQFSHDYGASGPVNFVSEVYPRVASGIVIAGGKTTPGYGDPGIWISDTDGSGFDVGSSSAILFTAKTFEASKFAQFGFADAASGSPEKPFFWYRTNELQVRSKAAYQTPVAWAAGTELSFLQMLRSDTHGSQFLVHESGEWWRRVNVDDDVIPITPAFPGAANYNAVLYVTRLALLDLSPRHDHEFCEETDAKSAPASGTSIDRDPGSHWDSQHTHEDGRYVAWRTRYTDATHHVTVYDLDSPAGKLQVVRNEGAGETTLFSVVSVFTDGILHDVDILDEEDGTLSVWVDKTLQGTAEEDYLAGDTSGFINHNLVSNDIELATHPHPNLGGGLGANGRVLCPQMNDSGTLSADSVVISRSIVLPTAGELDLDVRKNGTYEVRQRVDTAGKLTVIEDGTVRVNGNNGDVAGGEDLMIFVDAADVEEYINGALHGSYASLTDEDGTGWELSQRYAPAGMESAEFWDLRQKIFGM